MSNACSYPGCPDHPTGWTCDHFWSIDQTTPCTCKFCTIDIKQEKKMERPKLFIGTKLLVQTSPNEDECTKVGDEVIITDVNNATNGFWWKVVGCECQNTFGPSKKACNGWSEYKYGMDFFNQIFKIISHPRIPEEVSKSRFENLDLE